MDNIKIQQHIENINWGVVNEIFKAVEFGDRGADNLKIVFSESAYTSFAFDQNSKLIGFGRMISDKKYYGAIYDVIVRPEDQNKGIGRLIMNDLIEQSKHLRYITLFATPGNVEFYKKLGLKKMSTAMILPKDENIEKYYCE
jgi:aralkylamine N-acetyltransferase